MTVSHTEVGAFEADIVRLYEDAIAHDGVGVWVLDVESGEMLWGKRLCAIYELEGQTRENSYRRWAGRIHPDDLPAAEAAVTGAVARNCRTRSRFRVLLPGGQLQWMESRCNLTTSNHGRFSVVSCNRRLDADSTDIDDLDMLIDRLKLPVEAIEEA